MAIVGWGDGFTKRGRVMLVGTVALLLVGSAVALAVRSGGSSAKTEQPIVNATGGGGESSAPSSPAGDTGPTSSSTTETTKPPRKQPSGAPTTTASTTTTTAPPTPSEPYAYEVTLEPRCVKVGGSMTLTIRVKPYVTVGVIAMYADGETHDTMWGDTVGEEGVVVRTLPAPVSGPGQVLTSATESGTYRQGGTTVDFRVVEVLESC